MLVVLMLQIVLPVLNLFQELMEETQTTVQSAKPNTIRILPIVFVRHVTLHVMTVMIKPELVLLQNAQLAKRLELILLTVCLAEMGIMNLLLETPRDLIARLAISHVILAPVLSPRTVLETVHTGMLSLQLLLLVNPWIVHNVLTNSGNLCLAEIL